MFDEEYIAALEDLNIDNIELILGDKFQEWKQDTLEIEILTMKFDKEIKEFNKLLGNKKMHEAKKKWDLINKIMLRFFELRFKWEKFCLIEEDEDA